MVLKSVGYVLLNSTKYFINLFEWQLKPYFDIVCVFKQSYFPNAEALSSDSEVVRVGAELPKPRWRNTQKRDQDLEGDGISSSRNIVYLGVCPFRRLLGKTDAFIWRLF